MDRNTPAPKVPESPTPDDNMTREEKEDLEDHLEEFEGPDRREIRGEHKEPAHDPGVAHS
ncbi:MAG TPA: hypothetical protein VKS03_02040 [Thermoanaerobaculia bacterium]|nr:hypothetical protein [Thermoanaerobaculia bacterium]